MGLCYYCGRDMGPSNAPVHAACSAEYFRRVRACECVRCSAPGVWVGHATCGACDGVGGPYIGYPEGSAA